MAVEDDVLLIANRFLNKVKPAGDNITAACPFHRKADGSEEKHPSFSMSLTKGVYHCFACHESGNLLHFLRNMGVPYEVIGGQYQGLIDHLRENYNNQPGQKYDPITPSELVEEPMNEAVLGLFDYCPVPLVDPNIAYELDPNDPRVFQEATLRHFEVGFDQKHARITFPLRDLTGNLLGISGRTVIGEYPRYKVYDNEYLDFDLPARSQTKKSAVLWNAHNIFASTYFSQDADIVVVEGFKACMWVWECGFTNVVALAGSSLSNFHKWVLERLGATVHLMLDNDDAGKDAREGIIKKLAASTEVKIVEYDYRQPTLCTQEEVHTAISESKDYAVWSMNKYEEIGYGIR